MESHPVEAVENNVFGTRNLAVAAAAHGVRDFVLISSDKAVQPMSVMGVTKRIAELVVLAMDDGSTKFVPVRFGNVLDSTGSVVPIFRRQIADGGPVTVTDPAMRRFFMTLPEAVHLVLQAGAIGKQKQICVLDMGSPVRIVDLARQMIEDAGFTPGEDIPIVFTGKRPGEKLFEELSSLLEDTARTDHEHIRALVSGHIDRRQVASQIEGLRMACESRNVPGLIDAFRNIVPEYSPSPELLRMAADAQGRSAVGALNG
jgi:FlaA1/EpsC-like NDP-sugar epimerase